MNHFPGHVQLFHQDGTHGLHPVCLAGVDGHIHQPLDAAVQALIVIGDVPAGSLIAQVLFDGVEYDDGHGRILRGFVHGLVRVVQAGLAAHYAAHLAGQVDARFAGEAEVGGVLVQPGFAQTVAQRVEKVVAAVGKPLHNGLVLVLVPLRFGNPALGRRGKVRVIFGKVAAVGDGLVGVKLALNQRAQAGDHLENGAGGAAGVDVVVHQHIAGIRQDLPTFLSRRRQSVQVEGGIVGHGQHPALHVDNGHGGALGQRQGVLLPVAVFDDGLVFFQPCVVHQLAFLRAAHRGHVLGQRALRLLLIAGHDGQLDVVAVLRLGVAQFSSDLAHPVALHHPVALPQIAVLGQPVLHGGFNAVHADGVAVFIAFFLQLGPFLGGRDSAHVADDLRRQRRPGIDPLGAHGDLHAAQGHGLGFDLDHGFVRHVPGDDDGLGVEQVHLHFGVHGHDLQHGLLIQNHVFHIRTSGGFGLPAVLLPFFRAVDDLIALFQPRHGLGGGGYAGDGKVVVVPPLVFPGLQDAFADAGAEEEFPFVGLFIAADDEADGQLAAVALDDLGGLLNGQGKVAVLGLAVLAGVPVKGDVVNGLVLGQNHGVRVGNHAAAAAKHHLGGAAAFRFFLIGVAGTELQLRQAAEQIGEHAQDHDQHKNIPAVQVVAFPLFTAAKSVSHGKRPPFGGNQKGRPLIGPFSVCRPPATSARGIAAPRPVPWSTERPSGRVASGPRPAKRRSGRCKAGERLQRPSR